MSSVRGGGPRGRGRGGSQPTPARGRGSSSRARFFSGNAARGAIATRGTFGQPTQHTSSAVSQPWTRPNQNGLQRPPSQRGAFGTAKTRGSWQERYQTLMQARERERADAIRHGQIADPDKPRSLADAVTPVGTCQDMCAEYERVQRVVQKDVWDEELNPNHSAFATTEKEPNEARMVKKFRRAAAGLEEQLPSDLRPPSVLKRTCDYLFDEVIGHAPSLAHVHHFVWDRTRAVRNDFSIQQVTKPDELRMAIECYERIARFHILSLHQLALPQKPYSKYDWQQEREQLDRTLLSLMQYYDDSHGRVDLPNEAEFRAYCVIFQLQDPTPDLEDRVQTWPKNIVQDPRVQKAVDLYMAACNVMDAQGPLKPRANHLIARQDWQQFWTLVSSKEVSYLMACVAEIYFNLVRRTVLNALFRTFRMNSTMATPDWTVDTLCGLLAFDDEDQVYTYCERFGFSFKDREDGQQYLDLTSVRGRTLPEPDAGIAKQSRSSFVEDKRFGRTLPAVINGLGVKEAQSAGLVNEEEDDENGQGAMQIGSPESGLVNETGNGHSDMLDDEESLFIPDTTANSFSELHDPSAFTPAAENKTQSLFSHGISSTSTFGKPSHFGDQASIFTKPSDQQTGKHTFTSPFSNGATKPNFTNSIPSISDSSTTSPPLFSFPGNEAKPSSKQSDSHPKFSFGQPSADPSSIFTGGKTSSQGTPQFNFTTSAKQELSGLNRNGSQETSQLSKPPAPSIESRSPSPDPPKSPFSLSQPTEAPAAAPPTLPGVQPETKHSSLHQPTSPATSLNSAANNNPAPSSGLGSGVKRSSFSTDTRPKKPSPLSNSITASDENSAVAGESLESGDRAISQPSAAFAQPERSPKRNAAKEFETLVTKVADDLFNDPDVGLLKQYIEYAVGRMIKEVHSEITTELNNQEADDWRRFTLHRKYGRRWRDIFWQRRHAKTGRERRERRQRRLQQRGSQQIENSSLYDGSSLRESSREGSTFDAGAAHFDNRPDMGNFASTTTFDHYRRPQRNINAQEPEMGAKRRKSSRGEDVLMVSGKLGHKGLKSTSHIDERGRITKGAIIPTSHPNADLLQRSSFLGYSAAKDGGNIKNTTMSNYFRLKAMGLGKVDSLSGLRGTKRRSESLQALSPTSPPALREPALSRWTPERSTNRSLMPPPSSAPSRTAERNEDDEALFARLRAAREGLKEGVSFFHSETARDDAMLRSVSSQSSTDSPSMMKARMEARLRSSHRGTNDTSKSVPAYRLRESKFVPREHYGRAIDRAQEIRESRSRETSRPRSRTDQNSPEDAVHTSKATRHISDQGDNGLNQSAFEGHTAQSINGVSQSPYDASRGSTLPSTSNPFALKAQAPFSFSSHTTPMPMDNPFLQATASNMIESIASQPMIRFKDTEPSNTESLDHTIRPSQIDQSLTDSFGASSGSAFGKYPFQPDLAYNLIPAQQDSYMHSHSKAISLISDDEDDEVPSTEAVQNGQHFLEVQDAEQASDELLDDATDEEEYGSNANQYSHLAQRHEVGDDEDGTESQGWESQIDEETDHKYDRDGESVDEEYSEEDVNGYAGGEDDERAGDADIDEAETESGDENGEEYGYEDEDEDGYEYPNPEDWPRQYENPWASAAPPSSKNSALQDVGNSAEEAIELSD